MGLGFASTGPSLPRSDGCGLIIDNFAGGGGASTMKVGKKRAGRLLDGVQHDGFPS